MGALTSNRKRGCDSLNVNLKSPVSYSPFSELHTSKKAKLFRAFDEVADRTRPIRAFSKFFSYPAFKSELKREPHAPVRRQRVGNSVNFKKIASEVSSAVEHSAQHMGNYFSRKYENAREAALGTFRYTGDDKPYEVDKVAEEDVSEDSSIEEVEILGDQVHEKDQESDGILDDPHKFDGMIVEGDSRPSNSPPGINSTDRNLNVGSPEKLLESLHLGGEYDVMDARVYQKLLYASGMRDGKLNSLQFEIELKEKELQRQQLLRPQKKEVIKKDVAYEAFKPLTEEEEAEVTHAISNSSRRKILATHESSNISITGELLQCLRPGAWLNDEVINLYLELLKEREKREPEKFLKCHFFNTFFYKKLINGRGGYNYQSVRRWTSQRKLGYCIYDCDKIFVPIHKEVHWCLAVINIKEKKFQYLDSLNGGDNHVMKAMSRYLVDEVKDKNGKEIDVSSWEREFIEDLPQQHNGFDCGVFMIKYADFYSRDIGLCFSQENMPYFRRRTAKEILKLKVE